jgi:hypothetical protein
MGVQKMRQVYFYLFAAALGCSSQISYAWGFKGHQSVNRVAISMVASPKAKKFLEANQAQVIEFSNTPDTKWKGGEAREQERPMHWFEMDAYGKNRFGSGLSDLTFAKAEQELGKDYVNQYGLAMWRISDFYVQLTEALKAKDYKRAVQIAGVMGHYVGDMTQPMHATSDYDGQSINKPGAHKYYETTLVDQIDGNHLFDSVIKFAGERRTGLERSVSNELSSGDLQKIAWTEATDSFDAVATVYQRFDQEAPEDEWLKGDLMPRIGRAAALLGKIWDAAFEAAGSVELPGSNVEASEPEWIPLARR